MTFCVINLNMNIQRHIDNKVAGHFNKYRQILLLMGPRQVGKTTILKKMFPLAKYFLLDEEAVKKIFESYDSNVYKQNLSDSEYIILDEIHLMEDPGRASKIIYDLLPDKKLIVTGSSSFNIRNKTGESLAGRKIEYRLFPLTISEFLVQNETEKELNFDVIDNILNNTQSKIRPFDLANITNTMLVYGNYPFLVKTPRDINYLKNLTDSVIFKDIIELDLIENKKMASDLLKLLAYQIGNIVNYSELARMLNMDVRTVKKYIDIFEQSYIIFRLYPFSNNKRQELNKSPKIYFFDNGIRNSLINNFENIELRNDKGSLFENFVISEIYKANNYGEYNLNMNYWRIKSGSEVDLIISDNKKLIACEIKYSRGSVSKAFINRYPQANERIITLDNYY